VVDPDDPEPYVAELREEIRHRLRRTVIHHQQLKLAVPLRKRAGDRLVEPFRPRLVRGHDQAD
jgi:hypothetical protein